VRNLLSVPALMEESAPGYRGEARGRTGTAPRNHPDYRSMARRTTTTTTTTTKSMSTHMRSNLAFGGSVASIAHLRRLVREGTLWAAPMNDGGVGIKSLKSSGLSTGSRSRRGRGGKHVQSEALLSNWFLAACVREMWGASGGCSHSHDASGLLLQEMLPGVQQRESEAGEGVDRLKKDWHHKGSAPLKRSPQPTLASLRKDCFQSRRTRASCQTCGASTLVLHLPTKVIGHYCAGCCPVCSAAKRQSLAPPGPRA
jgi:hypothetical protein